MYDLILGDCIDVLKAMPDKSVECIVTDPPYGVGLAYEGYDDTLENLQHLIDHALPEMRRVAKRVVFTCGVRCIHLYPPPTWILAWFYNGAGFTPWGWSSWQPILVYGSDPNLSLRMRKPDTIRITACEPNNHGHPCSKPLRFMRKLITRVAPSPSDTILDPFMGSGTTGVAAIQLGHRFIGIELNGDYLAIAKRRIAEARPDFTTTLDLTAKEIHGS